ncbi:MAG: FAD-dependent oxidoreductase [Deltaproteobacteria bacterium]|nr:FAD-dependent oxidoreductase [Deltaproteobacteria bacterium]
MKTVRLQADALVIGGGTAGCAAAWLLAEKGLEVIVLEKAAIERSGCLAAGVNAVNAWIAPGREAADYARYALEDAHGIASWGLLLSMSARLGEAVGFLDRLGVPFHRGPDGRYVSRSWRNLKINGGDIKPALASCLKDRPNIRVVERVHALCYLAESGRGGEGALARPARICGAAGLRLNAPELVAVEAPAVVCATGGAAGLYRPNNPGRSGHKMWYPPFNTGGGWAMGIFAGAELTTLEMRFVALRLQDTAAPTGTLALGQGARQVNALGEDYEPRYGNTTSQRVLAWRAETEAGRGPCAMRAGPLDLPARRALTRSYLHMSPMQALKFLEGEAAAEEAAAAAAAGAGAASGAGNGHREFSFQIEGTEPYVIGGHTASGYQVDESRATTLPGLFACGDAAGGAPQKYVSGALAEGFIAAEGAALYLAGLRGKADRPPGDAPADARTPAAGPLEAGEGALASLTLSRLERLLEGFASGPAPAYGPEDLEEAMQKAMDLYAGGRGSGYRYGLEGLREAGRRVLGIWKLAFALKAETPRSLSRIWELLERLAVARHLIAHLAERTETRWPGFGEYAGHPGPDPALELFINSRLEAPPFVPPEDFGRHPPMMLRRSLADSRILDGPRPSLAEGGQPGPLFPGPAVPGEGAPSGEGA